MTVNDDDSINIVTMIDADTRFLFGPMITGVHLALVADVPSGMAGPRPALGVSIGLSMAVIPAALLAFVFIRQCSLHRSNSCKRMANGVDEEEWGGGSGGGYHHGVGLKNGENRGDESKIIPLRHGRGVRRYGSSTNIVNKADNNDEDNRIG